ncbi:MAG TPA: choice-of-anchor D domain-containing protein [Casimicrobiaceae bacterium]|nr:choice-of-anchor D domain-containing protein [Casimicrobiaceae bacterium]
MNLPRHLRNALIAALTLVPAFPVFATGNCANGKTLYAAPVSGLSCASSSCHKADPSQNTNKILNGANNPTKIANAINSGVPEMAIFKGKYTASDLDDLATWIAAAPTCPAGGAPVVNVAPASFTFATTNVGSTSAATTVTVSNTGTAPATGVSIANSNVAEFPTATTCPASLANGASCTISASFSPSAAGARSATLTVNSSAGAQTVALSGTGNVVAPGALSVPGPYAFAAQTVGSASAPAPFTLTNVGGSAVTISAVTSSNAAEFAVGGSTCSGSIAAGASCSFNVTFTPSAAGARAASITIASTGTGSPQSVAVSGTGTAVATPGALSVPGPYAFAAQTVGSASAPAPFTLTNVGGSAVTISAVTSSNAAEFAVGGSTCSGSIAAGASCSFNVTFTPSAAGARAASITIASTGTGSPQAIPLSGTGSSVATPGALSVPGAYSFGAQTIGAAGSPHAFTLVNTGGTAVTVSAVNSDNSAEFPISSSSCSGNVAPGASCSFSVTFTAAAVGARSASITIASTGTGSPQAIALSGTGTSVATPGALAIPAAYAFADQAVGVASAAQPFTVTNTGGTAVTVASLASGNPAEFAVGGSSCAGTVAPGASCSFGVTFTPSAAGARSTSITLVSDGVGSPQSFAVSGNGTSTTPPPTVATVDVIEYYYPPFDHYFITAKPLEIDVLDTGIIKGWVRTGNQFKAYPVGTPGKGTVCRFFSVSFAPKSSHFYTNLDVECGIVTADVAWMFEGKAFSIDAATSDGTCAAGTVPVYRLYNNGQGGAPNHRYVARPEVRDQMVASGWIAEGNLPGLAFMCSPQ